MDELHYVRQRDGSPPIDHIVAVFPKHRFKRHDCFCRTDHDRSAVKDVYLLIVRERDAKRMKGLIMQFDKQIAVRHKMDRTYYRR